MQFCTYAHYKPDGVMFYVGKGSSRRAHSAAGRNVAWNRTVKKHGGFSMEILGQWNVEQDAFDHEILLIDVMKSLRIPLVNISSGGLGSTGFRHTDEHKAFKSKMMLERNPMNDPELRAKQQIALLKAMKRPEVRAHQSAVRMGKKLPAAHIESLRKCHPMKPCIVNGVEYHSLMEASRRLGILHGTLKTWFDKPDRIRSKNYAHIIEARWL